MALEPAWDITSGDSDLLVMVVDTGIFAIHDDLLANMWRNTKEIPNNGLDDDRNGYIDDYFGMNAINRIGSGTDDHGHGTHVAGIIGAVANNKKGISGVAPRVKLVALKFLDNRGRGSTVNAIRAINYGIQLKKMGHKVVAFNNSYGSPTFSKPMLDVIREVNAQGILFIAAAGNASVDNDVKPSYPANYRVENVISVASGLSDTKHSTKSSIRIL
jgi:subtilisin family serine protease